jgi:PAS domain S-box-containing protein
MNDTDAFKACGGPLHVPASAAPVPARDSTPVPHKRTAQLVALLDAAPIGIYVVDADFRLYEANAVACSVFGAGTGWIGRDFDELIHVLWPNPYADDLLRQFRRTLETGEPYVHPEHSEERLDRHDVEHYEWQIHRVMLADDRPGVVCYFRDISERVLAFREIERQREALQKTLDIIPVGIAIAHDPQCRNMSASPRLAEMLGVSTDQNVSLSAENGPNSVFRCVRNGEVIPPEALPMQRAVRTGQEQRDVELDIEFADGRILNMIMSAAPLFDRAGRVRGAIGAHVDVTALKKVQRELEAADRQKDEFLAMLAHELRNPLAPIRSATELLGSIPISEPVVQSAAAMIKRQVSQLTRLVDDLLDVARITRGQIELKLAPVELAAAIALAVEAAEPLIREKGHALSVACPAQPVYVTGDSARLVQCILNLLTNAAKYTRAGGRIAVELTVDGATALISVRDNGDGIAPEFLTRMFDLFVQSEQTLDRSQGGLGVGLSLVHRIVSMHHGEVYGTSAGVGQGSTFAIRLPTIDQPAASTRHERPPKTGPRRVMIVDDNHDAAASLAMLLSLEGHETFTAFTAGDALADAPRFRPDVILLDIGLPEMDGYQVARLLRTMVELEGTRFVALSGYGTSGDRQRAHAAGFDDHLVKPVEFESLLRVLVPTAAP